MSRFDLASVSGTGEEVSALGYPISDELDDDELAGGRMSLFDCGNMYSSIDLEHAWLLPPADRRHEDHPTGITLLRGINRFRGRGHGTAVLGDWCC